MHSLGKIAQSLPDTTGKPKVIRILKENQGEILCDIKLHKDFLNTKQVVWPIKTNQKLVTLDFTKIWNVYCLKILKEWKDNSQTENSYKLHAW